ncbi:hypothetical protein Vadar_028455 [Vaccinium darrowii]|uniref:Uncharacterized protein n=1 Tax=Vaccinium darrowii TaxID=229202 RepID=A0ACB7XUN6_9ERIC|nr:hypothetical protein Vadar_028455 [Vaccinium darrowii]
MPNKYSYLSLSTSDLISEICPDTQNPSLCLKALRSDPRSARADLNGLALISLGIAETNAIQTKSHLIAKLSKGATSPVLKYRYETHAERYRETIDNLKVARTALKSHHIGTFMDRSSAAIDGPATCAYYFEGLPAEPTQLRQGNKKLEDLCTIIFVIHDRMTSG